MKQTRAERKHRRELKRKRLRKRLTYVNLLKKIAERKKKKASEYEGVTL